MIEYELLDRLSFIIVSIIVAIKLVCRYDGNYVASRGSALMNLGK